MPKSKSDSHVTPDRVFDLIKLHWMIEKDDMFDPCPENFKQDGLKISWTEINFVNPPYTLLKEFVDKAVDESFNWKKTIMLLPAKTDQEWFHSIRIWHKNIIWIRRRLKFKNNKDSSMQPHFLVMID